VCEEFVLERQVADRIRKEDHDENQAGDQWAKNDATGHEVKVAVKVGKDEHRWDNGKKKVHVEPAFGPPNRARQRQSSILNQKDEEQPEGVP
jgi:hypothetical protein